MSHFTHSDTRHHHVGCVVIPTLLSAMGIEHSWAPTWGDHPVCTHPPNSWVVRLLAGCGALPSAEITRMNPKPAACGDLVERCAELARTRLAPRAAGYDTTAEFPVENYRDLHAAGL